MGLDWFPFWLSLRVAALSTLISTAAGLWLAYLLANRSFRGKETLDAAVTLPLVLPPTVLGYYLLVVIGRESWFGRAWEAVFGGPLVFTWQAAVVAAILHSAPLLIKSARPLQHPFPSSGGLADWRDSGRGAYRCGGSWWIPSGPALMWLLIFISTLLSVAGQYFFRRRLLRGGRA